MRLIISGIYAPDVHVFLNIFVARKFSLLALPPVPGWGEAKTDDILDCQWSCLPEFRGLRDCKMHTRKLFSDQFLWRIFWLILHAMQFHRKQWSLSVKTTSWSMRLSIEATRDQLDRWQMTYMIHHHHIDWLKSIIYAIVTYPLSVIFVEDRGLL